MTAPNNSTFDLTAPRRPGKDDFNGVAKVDNAFKPPNPQTMANAAEWNTIEYILLAVARVCPYAVISVDGGATPFVQALATAPTGPTVSTFTVTRSSAGNVLVAWPANTFPPTGPLPVATLNQGPGMIHAVYEGNGVRVFTYNQSGTATDLDFTVTVH